MCFRIVLNEQIDGENILLYPNPTSETLTIKISDSQYVNTQIQIFNTIGNLVKETELPENGQINVSELSNGLYFVRFKDNSQQTLKFIKQ